jgi:hypothetical protein
LTRADYFDSLGAVKILFSEYAVPFPDKAIDLTNKVLKHLKAGDRLLVCELFNCDVTAWSNLMLDDAGFQKRLTSSARTLN